ncbi:hypothetical protein Cantr_09751 [Candida viswanathii]|uniref:Uncharacterized protein n=1 Tax=Candida viswanathii TaxID=5486 RepID=A0A367YCC6_9ASCO|nr:hypothetical protein Cantr_09751 [Candida viswanathii]
MFTRSLPRIAAGRATSFIRTNATTAKQYVRSKPKFYDLLKTPTTKSLILTLITTSIIIDTINSRKSLETLKKSYSLKFEILDELIAKLLKNEKTDIASELKLANSYTENKYNSRTDIEVDQQLDQFLKLLADEVEKADEVDQKQVLEPITIEKEVQPVVVTQLAEPKPKKTFY